MIRLRHSAVILVILIAGSAAGQSHKKVIDKGITIQTVTQHVQQLASDEWLGRDTPSPGLDSAAAYIARNFSQWGVESLPALGGYYQIVKMKSSVPSTDGHFAIKDSVFNLENQMLQLSDGQVDISAGVVFVDYGSREDFEAADVKGKIVIARSGTKSALTVRNIFIAGREKAALAAENGALALVELYNSPQTKWKILQYYIRNRDVSLDFENEMEEKDPNIQRFWLEDMDNSRLAYLKDYTGSAVLVVKGGGETRFNSQNVVGFVPGTDPLLKSEIVIFSAHYDHVGTGKPNEQGDTIYNGTRDNAIGTMTVLEAARIIAANPLKRSSLFILFTGEEKGLLGSEWYVNHPEIPLNEVVFCFNSDNAGYNDVTKATVIGLNRTTAGPIITKAAAVYKLETIDDPMPDQNLFDRSDQVSFARKGVPAIMYSMGITSFDEEINKYYHQAADNPDSVDYKYLLKFTKAYVLAASEIGNAAIKPVWIEGDKYFDAGEKLYNNTP
jgi:hypothetical protein